MTTVLRRARSLIITGGVAVLTVLSALASAPVADASVLPSWTIQATVNPGGDAANLLGSVSCPSATACMAVGYHMTTNYSFVAMAESWNGRGWTLTPMNPALSTPGSNLVAVSCTSASACTAVGYAGGTPLAERWNGASWSGQSLPVSPCSIVIGQGCSGSPPSQTLNGVSCASARACMAVGYVDDGTSEHDLAMAWNGSTWTIQATAAAPSGTSTSLNAVSCSSAKDCMAAGQLAAGPLGAATSETAWADHWNGRTWSGIQAPGIDLSGVSCTSAVACTAVGYAVPGTGSNRDTDVPLAVRWNGTGWANQGAPLPPSTIGTSKPTIGNPPGTFGTGSVPLFGTGSVPLGTEDIPGTLGTAATGRALRPAAVLPVGGHAPYPSALTGVSCASTTACVAVGWFGSATGGERTLSEIWNGTRWTIEYPGYAVPATISVLNGVSCTSAAACTATGWWDSQIWSTQGFYPIYTLAERYS